MLIKNFAVINSKAASKILYNLCANFILIYSHQRLHHSFPLVDKTKQISVSMKYIINITDRL